MKTFIRIILIMILATSFTLPTNAQQDLYNDLNKKLATLYRNGKTLEAIEIAKEALKVAEKTFGENHPYVSASLNNIALLYISEGQYENAEKLYERSLKIAEKYLGKDDPQLSAILENMVKCCKKLGETEKAEMLEARLDKIQE